MNLESDAVEVMPVLRVMNFIQKAERNSCISLPVLLIDFIDLIGTENRM
jgi:hypothetical protein